MHFGIKFCALCTRFRPLSVNDILYSQAARGSKWTQTGPSWIRRSRGITA